MARLGRPRVHADLRALIRRMATENGWGAPRIHGELLKLGFEVSERTISRYMPCRPTPPDVLNRWVTFLRNHGPEIAAMDFLTIPAATMRVLYGFFVIHHGRRRILHFNATGRTLGRFVSTRTARSRRGADERHLVRLVRRYADYYHKDRCHLALGKDTPAGRPVTPRPTAASRIVTLPRIGGLHHRYEWRDAA